MAAAKVLYGCAPFAFALVGLSLWLGGCSPPSPVTNGSVSAPSGKTVIDFWNGFTGPDGKAMDEMVRRFRKANPDIEVRTQTIPWGTYYDKLTLSLAYGGAPDVFVMHAGRLPEFASFGTLQPLDDFYAEAEAPWEKKFAPVPWRATFYEGKQVAVPLDVHPIGLYYNTKLFKEAGIVDAQGGAKPPKTFDEFIEAARRMTKDTDGDGRTDQWGFVFTWQRTNWLTIAGQFGASILSPDGKHSALDSPQNLRALQLMHDLIYKYKVAPKPEGVDAWLAFRQGKVGMALEGIYMLASLEEQKGLPFAGARVPQFGPIKAAWGGSHLLCQPKGIKPEQGRAAWKLMQFLSDQSLIWARAGQVPARSDIRSSPQFGALQVQTQFATQLPFVQYEPLHPKSNAIFPLIEPGIEAVMLDIATPQEAMRDVTRRVNQVLERP
ncbi:MAG: ABC transporter substrate-binding protein [Armatimonadetes bacterium]|nr:ABC transporter substrate-binding protein [Armatimonadota bacterium]